MKKFYCVALVISHFLVGLFVFLLASLDDQSYYSASVQILLDETIEGLEKNENDLLYRLKEFRSHQIFTYES